MCELAAVIAAALLLDLAFGDPVYGLHPVRLMGKAAAGLETALRRMRLSGRSGGALLAALMLVLFAGAYLALDYTLGRLHPWPGTVLAVLVVYSCIGLHDLLDHARAVARALDAGSTSRMRQAVQKMVGRDALKLDHSAAARAAVESVAENFVDAFLSPLVWFIAGAAIGHLSGFNTLPAAAAGVLTHRTVNTLDAMVGYRNERYGRFGWASARLDDAMNFLPARMSLLLLPAAAAACGLDARGSWKTGQRDRLKHPSPNSGHAESCVAGALGVRLGGPTAYAHGTTVKPWIGDGECDVSSRDILRCCTLVSCAGWLSAALVLLSLAASCLV